MLSKILKIITFLTLRSIYIGYVWARILCLMKEKTTMRNWRRATDMMTKWMAVAWILLLILLGAYTNARLCRSTVTNRDFRDRKEDTGC